MRAAVSTNNLPPIIKYLLNLTVVSTMSSVLAYYIWKRTPLFTFGSGG
jgi:regulatory protein YycH of two-component signal transduction system YycFG